MQDATEAYQQKRNCKPTLPDFYNMMLECHKDDPSGYAVLYIDASIKGNLASSLSHSCNPNCDASITAIDGKYAVSLYSRFPIKQGEELTIDYSAATNDLNECHAAVCLFM